MAPRLSAEDEEVIRLLRAQPKISGAEAKKRNENSFKPRRHTKLRQKERDEIRNARITAAKAEASCTAILEHQTAPLIDEAVVRAPGHATLHPNNKVEELRTGIGSEGIFRSATDKTSSTLKTNVNIIATQEPQTTPEFTAKVPVPGILKVSNGIQITEGVSGDNRAKQTSAKTIPLRIYGRRQPQFTPRKDIHGISQDADALILAMAPIAKIVATQKSRDSNSPTPEDIKSEDRSDDESDSDPTKASESLLTLEECIQSSCLATQSQLVIDVDLNASPAAELDFESQLADEEAQNGDSEDQDEQFLDDLDLEILNLGQNDDDIPSTARNPVPSPKRSRTFDDKLFVQSPSRTPVEAHSEIDDWHERPQLKKRRTTRRIPSAEAKGAALLELRKRQASNVTKIPRTSQKKTASQSAKKKKPRRLPVDELVIASQRIEDPDVEVLSPPLELSEDLIALISDGDTSDKQPSRKRALKINNQPRRQRKLVEPIEIIRFRMPSRRLSSPVLQIRTPFSDGFEGREADPIGRVMPTKHTIRRHEASQRAPVYFPQLIIVAEKPVERSDLAIQQPRRLGVKGSKARSSPERLPATAQEEQPFQGDRDLPQDNEYLERPRSPLCISQHLPTSDIRRIVPLVTVQPELRKGLSGKELPRSALVDPEVERQLSQVAMERQVRYYSSDEDESQNESEIDDEEESQKGDAKSENMEEKSSKGSCEGNESEDGFADDENIVIVLENDATSYLTSNGPFIEKSNDELDEDQMQMNDEREDGIEICINPNEGLSSRSIAPVEAESLQQFANQILKDEHSILELQIPNSQLFPIKESQLQPRSYLATQYQDPESSWRPRIPNTAGISMEAQEEIHDSPSPIPIRRQKSNSIHNFSPRKRSILRKRAISSELSIIKQRAKSTLSGKPPRHISTSRRSKSPIRSPSPEIPETQYPEPPHTIMVPDNGSYFSQASYCLQTPMKNNLFTRTVSMPAFRHHLQLNAVDEEILAGDISIFESFKLTMSSEKSGKSRQLRLLSQTPDGKEKTLKMLTRQMSQDMGTIPSRSRTMSALQPRFKTPLRVPVKEE